MKKVIKRASLIALSALMLGSSVATLASCGGTDLDGVIDVYIFAGTDDQETNTNMVAAWAEQYTEKLKAANPDKFGADFQIKTNCSFQSDTAKYFQTLQQDLAAGTAPDVFYVSPKYVKAYSQVGYVLDLSQYIDFSQTDTYDVNEVFGEALGFYAYDSANKIIGSAVTYDTTAKAFKNAAGGTAGLYGLPKDYSSFGLGYNANFFSTEMKTAYGSTQVADADKNASVGAIVQDATTKTAANGIINVGKPTTYYPYNFYLYGSYDEALEKGDSVAEASKKNGGYTVTIPGYPNDTFDTGIADSADTAYDDTIGYTVYTYAEYSAISWAVCYYYNKFVPEHATVYGNDQYEGTLYLLPWLAGNNADYINAQDSTRTSDGASVKAFQSVESGSYVNAAGETINYGLDNEEFIETYAAFAAYGSDWNANSFYCGDGKEAGGYANFKEGNVIFYGVGTWDAAGFNEISPEVLKYAIMAEPVSEDYALYSRIKDAKNNPQSYKCTGTADTDGKTNDTTFKAEYTAAEIKANQMIRQTQWKARMDSVGYGVNGALANVDDDDKWFVEACADLVASMTVNRDSQVTLTLAGSQLPNYADMCIEYKDKTGAFAGLVTPDDANYNTYYECAKGIVNAEDPSMSLKDYMAQNYPTLTYDQTKANTTLKRIGTFVKAFSALKMVTLDKYSRNLSVRMVSGVNAVKDSCMYTFDAAWIDVFSATKATTLVAYMDKKTNNFLYSQNKFSDTYVNDSTLCTPYAYCLGRLALTKAQLQVAIDMETSILG